MKLDLEIGFLASAFIRLSKYERNKEFWRTLRDTKKQLVLDVNNEDFWSIIQQYRMENSSLATFKQDYIYMQCIVYNNIYVNHVRV